MNIIRISLSVVLISFLLIFCSTPQKQISLNIQKNTTIDSVPQLTYQEMLVDFDSLVSYIKQVSPIIYFNKEVRGIDFNAHCKLLRAKIKPETSIPQYLNIVMKTINTAQDAHTSRMPTNLTKILENDWIPNYGTKVVGYDSTAFQYTHIYDKYFSKAFSTNLKLELLYTKGEYYNLLPFSYNGKVFPSSLKLISCNSQNIHQFVKGMVELVSPLRWDQINDRVYYEDFYQSPFIYKEDSLHLEFLDMNNKKIKLSIAKQDTVTFLEEKKRDFGYDFTDSIITHYFEKENIFYAKLPQMKVEFGDTINNRIKSIIYNNKVDAIVIDIRGNGGGNDNTYANFLKHIVKDTLQIDVKVGRNYSYVNRKFYDLNKDSILNDSSQSFKLRGAPTLTNSDMFYITMPKYNFVIPDSIQYPFNGKIYILQDRFIYSSASNLSSLTLDNKQLISIGENTDLLGGLQTITTAICLPHSKLFFRVEPQIDFSNTKTKVDIFHNNVEHLVKYSIDFIYERATTADDVFGKNFLLTKDPMFKKALELEEIRKNN